jgi:hypothetical protein
LRAAGGLAFCLAVLASRGLAQEVPPDAIEQLRHVVGDRVEAVTILGGDGEQFLR